MGHQKGMIFRNTNWDTRGVYFIVFAILVYIVLVSNGWLSGVTNTEPDM